MRQLLTEGIGTSTATLDAGRASESVTIMVVALIVVVLTTALILASPLTRRSRDAARPAAPTDAIPEPGRPGVVRLLAVVIVLWVATRLRRLVRRP